jgi:hypothetical protein
LQLQGRRRDRARRRSAGEGAVRRQIEAPAAAALSGKGERAISIVTCSLVTCAIAAGDRRPER